MMNTLLMDTVPLWTLAAAVLVLAAAALWRYISRKSFMKILARVAGNPELADTLLRRRYTARYLLSRTGAIDAYARKNGPDIIRLSGIDDLWLRRLMTAKKKGDFVRVLRYTGEKGLFKCFLVSMEKKSLARILIGWLEQSGEYLNMRKLASGGKGEDFDGAVARDLFREKLPEIREMMGDPEWPSRYFAAKLLLHDLGEDRSIRSLWECFADSHPLVRKTVASAFRAPDTERLFRELYGLVLRDPVYEVRKSSFDRIQKDFPEQYRPDPAGLSDSEVYHVLELLRDGNSDDENMAMHFLESENLELRFMAARFLEQNGAFVRLCGTAGLGDRKDFDRRLRLLRNACDINMVAFLSLAEQSDNPGSLLICALLLAEKGDRSHITAMARKVFASSRGGDGQMELYRAVLACIAARGNDASFELFDRELRARKDDGPLMEALLGSVSARGADILAGTLLEFMYEMDFKYESALMAAMRQVPASLLLPDIFTILQGGRDRFHHTVRMRALKLLGELNMEYCVQSILENLPFLTVEEGREFTRVLAGYPQKTMVKKIEELLNTADAKIRASLIASIPVTGEKTLLKHVVKSLKDADPDVRISGVWALVDLDDQKMLHEALSMLRDPVERVRTQAAQVLGMRGSDAVIRELAATLADENELVPVKKGAIYGLGFSPSAASVDVLVTRLEAGEDELTADIINALVRKTDRKQSARLIELFKDALPGLRARIAEVFKKMNEKGEKVLEDLLREEIPSLRPFIAEILEATGFIENRIRGLSHRNPSVRKESAEVLSLVGTKSAFRGIVMAARDPDEDVRVMVTRALEKLGTKEGAEILNFLENDPDHRVRKYTHWALERLKAKSL